MRGWRKDFGWPIEGCNRLDGDDTVLLADKTVCDNSELCIGV